MIVACLNSFQVQTWSSDPNQYVADEDDVTYSCRVSGWNNMLNVTNAFFILLLQFELCSNFYLFSFTGTKHSERRSLDIKFCKGSLQHCRWVGWNFFTREVLLCAGILLLEELVTVFEMDGLRLIVEAVQQRLIEASQAKALGRTDWWKASK